MKVKDFSDFKFTLGEITGVAKSLENEGASDSLLQSVKKLEEQFMKLFSKDVPTEETERVGAISRPSAEELERKNNPKKAEEDKAMGKVIEDKVLKDE